MKNHKPPFRIVITGGHLTPAIATITALQRRDLSVRIYFIGRDKVSDSQETKSHEKEAMKELGVSFLSLTTGRLTKAGSLVEIVSSLIKVPIGFCMAFWYLLTIRPDAIVSFGGYIAVPIVIVGWVMGIPIITHEQTQSVGLGTKIIALFSNVVCVSDPTQVQSFPFVRSVYTGLPLRDVIVSAAKELKYKKAKHSRPCILITGGTTGALSINTVVYDALPQLLCIANVVHQVGAMSIMHARQIQNTLHKKSTYVYTCIEYLRESDYVSLLQKSDVVVGRSGANTVAEVAALAKSAILIPLPWASFDEQYKNAEVLQKAGSASILPQKDLTRSTLVSLVTRHIEKRDMYEAHAKVFAKSVRLDAAELLCDEIIFLVRTV
ncbi:MAG: glycosyltransferase [Patescibacteria group bacterium]